MSVPMGVDPDLLRAFVYIAEDGSFTRAAERVGRTQSAVSMQVQRLEALLGEKVLARGKGGAVQLTAHGRYLLDKAREVLALNDAIWSAFHAPVVRGTVRLGTPDDYAMRFLPPVLKRFAQTHPAVEVDVLCLPSSDLVGRLKAGELDLTLVSSTHAIVATSRNLDCSLVPRCVRQTGFNLERNRNTAWSRSLPVTARTVAWGRNPEQAR